MCVPGTANTGATATTDAGAGDGGTFTCPSPFALADFDGDGVTDCLLTAGTTAAGCPGQSILFHKGLGGGTYSATAVVTPYAVPVGASGSGVDLSGDGCADLLLQEYDATHQTTSFGYARSLCDGTFGPIPVPLGIYIGSQVSYALGPGTLADFNGDGRPDLFYASHTIGDLSRTIHWITLRDNGDPTYPALVLVDTNAGGVCGAYGSFGSSVEAGDFNNDGKLDAMVVLDYVGLAPTNHYDEVIIALGDGKDGFTSMLQVGGTKTTSGSLGASIGDFNADGNLDLSVETISTTTTTQIFYGDGAGNFSTTPP